MVIIGDLLIVVAMFLSANLALAWAELASFDIHGDKSALAGLGGAFFFMVMRWVFVAAVLVIAALRMSAFIVPLPALAAAVWGLNRGWMPRHRILTLAFVALAAWGHVAGWRAGYRSPAPLPVAE